jgi:hypothetical protein
MLAIISTIVGEERELAGLVYRIMIVQTLHGKPFGHIFKKTANSNRVFTTFDELVVRSDLRAGKPKANVQN